MRHTTQRAMACRCSFCRCQQILDMSWLPSYFLLTSKLAALSRHCRLFRNDVLGGNRNILCLIIQRPRSLQLSLFFQVYMTFTVLHLRMLFLTFSLPICYMFCFILVGNHCFAALHLFLTSFSKCFFLLFFVTGCYG